MLPHWLEQKGKEHCAEYKEAVAQLWETAGPMTQRLLHAAGVPPPDPSLNSAEPSNQCVQAGNSGAQDTGGEEGPTAGES